MTLAARGLALQGFLLSPVAMAVQGLLAITAVDPPAPPPSPKRSKVEYAGGGPGNDISLADYLKRFNPPALKNLLPSKNRRRQRMEEEEAQLLSVIF